MPTASLCGSPQWAFGCECRHGRPPANGRLQVHIHAPAVSPAAQHVSAPMDLAHPAGAESLAPQPSQLASARNSPLSVSSGLGGNPEERFKPLDEFRKIGFVLPKRTTIDCCLALFYPRYRGPLGLAAQQNGARIAPTYAGLVAPVGRLQRIGQAPATASSPRSRWVWAR